ncbi:MAG: stage V sporulation protein T [Lachnospiraceae bacterium]|nr:stage V sporulation protein T [Lachnospiraceae bacterium]
MKATGIVRRIDDLGRIVVPKEIRRTLRIRESDPLEIFMGNEGEIILKKYSPIGELGEFAKQYADAIYQTIGRTVFITDRDRVVAVAGAGKKEYEGTEISSRLSMAIEERANGKAFKEESGFIKITTEEREEYSSQVISTIISQGDAIGAVILCEKDDRKKVGDMEWKVAEAAAVFLGKQMEQ